MPSGLFSARLPALAEGPAAWSSGLLALLSDGGAGERDSLGPDLMCLGPLDPVAERGAEKSGDRSIGHWALARAFVALKLR